MHKYLPTCLTSPFSRLKTPFHDLPQPKSPMCVRVCVCVSTGIAGIHFRVHVRGGRHSFLSLPLLERVISLSPVSARCVQHVAACCSVLQRVPLSSHNLVCVRLSPPSSLYVYICLRPCACVRLFLVPLCCMYWVSARYLHVCLHFCRSVCLCHVCWV